MNDYQKIVETVTSIFTGTDNREWATVERAFAATVHLDYSSLSGQPAVSIPAAAIISSWKTVLPGFTATHHQLGNFMVAQQEKEATVTCYGTASHYLPNDTGQDIWTIIGSYEFHLQQQGTGWEVDKMIFHLKYQDGNLTLPALAVENVKQSK